MNNNKYKVVMPECFDKRAEYEMTLKEYIDGVTVVGEDGTKYPASFVTPNRMKQDLDCWAQLGEPFYAEPGLIIISEVTMETIENAIGILWKEGFFELLKPWSYISES